MSLKKNAYPVSAENAVPQASYNIGKWMNTLKEVYLKTSIGGKRDDVLKDLTASWSDMEKFDFSNWMKYYESGDQNKYKTAQQHDYYINENIPNYFIPNPKKGVPSPLRSVSDEINDIVAQPAPTKIAPPAEPIDPGPTKEEKEAEKKAIVEAQRAKILARLHSAEKLLSSHEGQLFAGPDFERLLSSIYDLKRQIQLSNKISLSAQTCIDLIIRQARKLHREGFDAPAQYMVKLAQQMPGNGQAAFGDTPLAGSEPNGQGALGNNIPASALTNPGTPSMTDKNEAPQDGLSGFFDNLNGAGVTIFDKNEVSDIDMDDDVSIDEEITPDVELMAQAQEAPETMQPKPSGKGLPPVKKDQGHIQNAEPRRDDYDDIIDSALNNVKIENVLSKLEDISKIYRNREIARNLAVVDLMLNRLGLAEMFPSLGEIASKTLDSGQYCLTRLEDIISRLHASNHISDIELRNNNEPEDPNAKRVKNNLENSEKKEKDRKRVRQEMQDNQLAEKVKPQVADTAEEVGNAPAELEVENPVPAPQPKPAAPQQ